MNEKQFLKRLKKTHKKEWRITRNGRIRCKGGCPITVVARPRGPIINASKVDNVSKQLGIDVNLMINIIEAADTPLHYALSRALRERRAKILSVLGLKEHTSYL